MDAELQSIEGDIEKVFSAYNRHLSRAREGMPVVDVSEFSKEGISLARSEPLNHVNQGEIKGDGLPLNRRLTGGSAIMIKPGDFHYAIALPESGEYPGRKEDLFERYIGPSIIDSCVDVGVEQERLGLAEDSDELCVLLDGKPLSGNSTYVDYDSGSILFVGMVSLEEWPAEDLERWIRLRDGEEHQVEEKKYIERLPALSEDPALNRTGLKESYQEHFLDHIADKFPFEYREESLTDDGMDYWRRERYSTDEWLENPVDGEGRDYRGFCLLTGDSRNRFSLQGRYDGFEDLESGEEVFK